MDGDSGIDPRLRDGLQNTQPPIEHPHSIGTGTSSHSVRLPPPNPQTPYHPQQSPRQNQQYPPWSAEPGYPNYLPYNSGSQASTSSPNGYPPQPLLSASASSGPQYADPRPNDAKRLRACEACRGLKVRCEPDPNGGACKRCAKTGKHCMITTPSRKRQKKTDGRVAELEKRIDALTQQSAALTATLATKDGPEDLETRRHGGEGLMQYETPSHTSAHHDIFPRQSPFQDPVFSPSRAPGSGEQSLPPQRNGHVSKEAHMYDPLEPTVGRETSQLPRQGAHHNVDTHGQILSSTRHNVDNVLKTVDSKFAQSLLDHYNADMVPLAPLVNLSDVTIEHLRESRPTLFGVVVLVTSEDMAPDLHRMLAKHVISDLAEKTFVKNEKSLELTQSLLILAVWHWQDGDFSFYNLYAGIADAMILALGIDRACNRLDEVDLALAMAPKTSDYVIQARAWLACHYLSSIPGSNGKSFDFHDTIKPFESSVRMAARLVEQDRDTAPLYEIASELAKVENSIRAALDNPKTAVHDFLLIPADLSTPKASPLPAFESRACLVYAFENFRKLNQAATTPKPGKGRTKAKPDNRVSDIEKVIGMVSGAISIMFDCVASLPAPQIRTLPPFRIVQLAHAATLIVYFDLTSRSTTKLAPSSGNVNPQLDESKTARALLSQLIDSLQSASKEKPSHPSTASPVTPRGTSITLLNFLQSLMVRFDKVCTDIKNKAGDNRPHDSQQPIEDPSSTGGNRALHLLSEVATGTDTTATTTSGSGVDRKPVATGEGDRDGIEKKLHQLVSLDKFIVVAVEENETGSGSNSNANTNLPPPVDDSLIQEILTMMSKEVD